MCRVRAKILVARRSHGNACYAGYKLFKLGKFQSISGRVGNIFYFMNVRKHFVHSHDSFSDYSVS